MSVMPEQQWLQEQVTSLAQRVTLLEAENKALRNLANNLRPGPISEALAGDMATEYRAAGVPSEASALSGWESSHDFPPPWHGKRVYIIPVDLQNIPVAAVETVLMRAGITYWVDNPAPPRGGEPDICFSAGCKKAAMPGSVLCQEHYAGLPAPMRGEAPVEPGEGYEMKVTEEMISRFLNWRLPENFRPDGGITFNPEYNVEWNAKQGLPPARHQPVGTNLLDYEQAKAMLEHVLGDGQPQTKPAPVEPKQHWWARNVVFSSSYHDTAGWMLALGFSTAAERDAVLDEVEAAQTKPAPVEPTCAYCGGHDNQHATDCDRDECNHLRSDFVKGLPPSEIGVRERRQCRDCGKSFTLQSTRQPPTKDGHQ